MKKWITIPVVAAMILTAGLIPSVMLENTVRYEVVAPNVVLHQNSVRCSGNLYPQFSCQVMAGGLYEVQEVYAGQGAAVEQGETVARVRQIEDAPFYTYETRQDAGTQMDSSQLEVLAGLYGSSVGDLSGLLGENGWSIAQQYLEAQAERNTELLVMAPISGTISTRMPMEGTVIRAGESLYSIISHQSWMVLAQVSEKQAVELSLYDPVKVSGDGLGSGEEHWGTVTGISPQTKKIFNGTGYDNVVEVEITLEDLVGNFTTGISVKAEIFTEDAKEILMLPYEAVMQNSDNVEYVLVAGLGGLEERPVKTGAEMTAGVEIAQGLEREELVVVAPGYSEADAPKIYLLEESE